jgi:23S rRNA pseudouridine1911/1915/1917 synthase
VLVSGAPCKPSTRVVAGDAIEVRLDAAEVEMPQSEPLPLEILYEDTDLAVVNKPPGMVVHPGSGHVSGTLVAAVAHHFQQLSTVGGPARPGIVHRLDRDTSGVIVVARNDRAHEQIAAQFKDRTVFKSYLAICTGVPDRDRDWIELPIGRHPRDRKKMAIRAGHATSREARTFYEVLERFGGHCLVRAEPKTGRTHQIRLHLATIGHPVLCDRDYGGHTEITVEEILATEARSGRPRTLAPSTGAAARPILLRQALHAAELAIDHPTTGERVTFTAPLPADMAAVLAALRGPTRTKQQGGEDDVR